MVVLDTGIRQELETSMIGATGILNFYKKYFEVDQECDIFL